MFRFSLLLTLICSLSASAANKRPNILFIVSEDNGPELGCYGDPNALAHDLSPTLDQLARDGVMFQNAFVPYSVCSPSRACFYTGTHVAQNGHEGLATHKFAMHEAYPTFYKLLQEAGYRTGLIGKLHINPGSAVSSHVDFRAISGANFGQSGRNMRNYATQAKKFIIGDYDEADVDNPFLLTINYPDAHLPMHHLAPTGDTGDADTLPKNPVSGDDVTTIPWVGTTSDRLRDQTAGYYNCLRRLDDGIAMVLADLDATGLRDDTLVIYIGDHGAQFSRGKTSVYEAGLRVPMIVRWPGATADLPGEFNPRTELTSTTDIMPTMLKAAGVAVPTLCSGRALQPLLEGKRLPWRQYIFAHATGSAPSLNYIQLSARDRRFKLISSPFKDASMSDVLKGLPNRCAVAYLGGKSHFSAGTSQPEIDSAATPQHVKDAYARYLNPPRYELYDLDADPYEWNNLVEDPAMAKTKQRLIAALAAWQADPIIADPWIALENVERFGTMQEDAIGTNYRGARSFVWDYLKPSTDWNFLRWKRERHPVSVPPAQREQ
ncbi:MAG: N-sulfoglucosamine sulfohydrolase [Verrucomicrobiales bacterium]|jgi:N-sulfoglucosamine sulfohydrolase